MKKISRISLIAGFILGSTLLQNCGSDESSPKEDVYLAGFLDEGKNNYSVVYVKNGEPTVIGGGDVYESANDITFDGSDMYIAGYTNDYTNVLYWKNGVKNFVPKNSDFEFSWEEILKIAVVNGKKYFLTYGPNGSNAYRYYVDGVKTILPNQNGVEDMAVSAGNVYVVGKSITNKAVYWKNGVMKELYNGDSGATSISIVGSDVYIVGWYINADSYPQPVVWKNDVMTEVGDPGAYPYEICVSGKDVYVAGQLSSDDSIILWKNGVVTNLNLDGHSISNIFDMKAKNGNVYFLTDDASTGYAVLFKNGEIVPPFDGTTYEGELFSIALK